MVFSASQYQKALHQLKPSLAYPLVDGGCLRVGINWLSLQPLADHATIRLGGGEKLARLHDFLCTSLTGGRTYLTPDDMAAFTIIDGCEFRLDPDNVWLHVAGVRLECIWFTKLAPQLAGWLSLCCDDSRLAIPVLDRRKSLRSEWDGSAIRLTLCDEYDKSENFSGLCDAARLRDGLLQAAASVQDWAEPRMVQYGEVWLSTDERNINLVGDAGGDCEILTLYKPEAVQLALRLALLLQHGPAAPPGITTV